jgi:ubiquitin C-terminal hydrolase
MNHGRNGNHAVVLDLSEFLVWCYVCDDYVLGAREAFAWLLDAADVGGVESGRLKRSHLTQQQLATVNRVCGLQNLGNTCYMNAALQLMLNCAPIRGYFSSCSQFVKSRPQNGRISDAFLELCDLVFINTVNSSTNSYVSPRSLVREVKTVNPMFEGYSQQDSMDFMRCLWDRLHEELLYDRDDTDDDDDSCSCSTDGEKKVPSYTPYTPKHRSIISDTFGGVLRSRIDCLSCRGVSIKEDPFFDLSLPISSVSTGAADTLSPSTPSSTATAASTTPKSPTLEYMGNIFTSLGESLGFSGKTARLENCLASFCSPERLEGRDRYYCEQCKAKVSCVKTLTIQSLPNVLYLLFLNNCV